MPRIQCALLALAFLVPLGAARADTLKVPSDEFATIQAAVSAAGTGDVVQVAKGVYAETVNIFTNGITLKGKGAVIDAEYKGPCVTVGATDVTLTGFTLVNGTAGILDDLNEGSTAPDRLTVSKCVIRSCAVGIQLSGAGILIDKTVVEGCGSGIILESANLFQPLVLTRNRVERIQGSGIRITAPAVELERNTVERCVGNGIIVSLVLKAEGTGLASFFTKNQVRQALSTGMRVSAQFGVGTVSITKNKLQENGRGLEAVGHLFEIRDNDCSNNSENGMQLGTADDDHFAISVVEGNTCRGNGQNGMHIAGPLLCRIDPQTANQIVDNECEDNGFDGMIITHAHRDEFIDNESSKNGGDGIDIDAKYFGIILDGNTCAKNEHEGIDNNGIETELRNNKCKGNARGVGPDLAGTGDDGTGSAIDQGGNKFGTGGFDVQARLDLDGGA